MSNLSKEDLAQLTERVNERLAEFEFPLAHTMEGQRLSRGIVRLVHDAIEEWWNEEEEHEVKLTFPIHELFRSTENPIDSFLKVPGADFVSALRSNLVKPELEESSQTETELPVTKLADGISARLLKNSYQEVKDAADLVQSQQAMSDKSSVNSPVIHGIPTFTPPTAPTLSPLATSTLGPEHTVVTPFKPRTLAEVDAEQTPAATGTSDKSAQLIDKSSKHGTNVRVTMLFK